MQRRHNQLVFFFVCIQLLCFWPMTTMTNWLIVMSKKALSRAIAIELSWQQVWSSRGGRSSFNINWRDDLLPTSYIISKVSFRRRNRSNPNKLIWLHSAGGVMRCVRRWIPIICLGKRGLFWGDFSVSIKILIVLIHHFFTSLTIHDWQNGNKKLKHLS